MADTKPVYQYINGSWEKQNAYQYINGSWVEISSISHLPTPTPNLVYTLSSDGTYYIVGTGFTSIQAINQDSSGGNGGSGLDSNWKGGDVVIPNTYNNKPVLAIAPKAFYNVNNIDSVYVYNGITTIGHRAFQSYPDENRLETVQLPSSVTNFTPNSGRLFWGRAGLESAILNCSAQNGDYRSMFYNCSNLTNLDLSSFVGTNITNVSSMFYNCSNLTNLDLSGLTGQNITDVSYMFLGCSKLQRLDIRNFDFSSVTSSQYAFGSNRSDSVPTNCLIIVKDLASASWVQNHSVPNFTNIKTVEEYEDS